MRASTPTTASASSRDSVSCRRQRTSSSAGNGSPGLDGETRDYYVRQLHDWKGSVDTEVMAVRGALHYSRICGATLARAHARWGDRIAIASYLGKSDAFDRAIADFSVAYADQNERDYETLVHAVKSGRISAQTGV